jgi:hypothetical protein
MSWPRCLPLLLVCGNCWAAGEYVIGGGVEADSADSMAGALYANKAVGDETWLSGGIARSSVDLNVRDSLQTWYVDASLEHFFDPVGVRLGAAYWGDDRLLDSIDVLASAYLRGSRGYLGVDYEYRDFELDLPATDFFASREVRFDAHGIGLSGRLGLGERVDLHASGITYDYSVDLSRAGRRDIANFLTASRLSLINSLVDYRATVGLGIDFGLKHLAIDAARWKGAVAGSITHSYSMRFMMPLGDTSDIEFGLGYDDSDSYGEVMIFSMYLYFYGGT